MQGDAERSLERLHELAEKELGKITNDPTLDFTSFRTSLIGLTDVTRQFFERLVAQLEKGIASMKDDYRAELMVAGPSSSLPAPTATAADAGEEEEGDAMMREVADDDGYEEQEEEEEDGGRGGRAGGGGGGGAGNQRRESKRQRGLAVGSNAQRMNTRSSTATAAATATAPNTDANSRAAVAAATRRDVVVALEEGGGGGDGGDVEMTKEGLERQQGFWTCGNCTFNNTDLDSYECSVCEGPRVEE